MPEGNNEVPEEFYDVVDQFIELANKLAESWPSARVSSAILYAAARYNAFNFYALESDINQNKENAIEYYCEQYKKMLLNNLEELSESSSTQENV